MLSGRAFTHHVAQPSCQPSSSSSSSSYFVKQGLTLFFRLVFFCLNDNAHAYSASLDFAMLPRLTSSSLRSAYLCRLGPKVCTTRYVPPNCVCITHSSSFLQPPATIILSLGQVVFVKAGVARREPCAYTL